MSVDSNIIKRLRVFIGGDLGESAANLIESQAAQIEVMRAAIRNVEIDAEECMDFDGCTAMLLPTDTYHAIVESVEIHQSQALEQFAAKIRKQALEDAIDVVLYEQYDDPYDLVNAIREMAKERK